MTDETWLICGGRDFAHQAMFDEVMSRLVEMWGLPSKIVHGAAKGADAMADAWGRRFAIEVVQTRFIKNVQTLFNRGM